MTDGIIQATPAELWKAWSTSEGYQKLGSAKCDVAFCVGGLIRSVYSAQARLGDESTIQSQIMAHEPERMILQASFAAATAKPIPASNSLDRIEQEEIMEPQRPEVRSQC